MSETPPSGSSTDTNQNPRCSVTTFAASALQRGQDIASTVAPRKFVDAAARTGGFAARSLRMTVQPSQRKYPEVPIAAPYPITSCDS